MEKEIEGFIFKGSVFDQNDQMQFVFYGNCELGSFKIILNNENSYFFSESIEKTEWKTPFNTFADKIFYRSLAEKKKLKLDFENKKIRTFEYDVRPIEQFLMDKCIYGGIKILGVFNLVNNIYVFVNPIISKSSYYPKYKMFSFDIETSKDGRVLSIAYHANIGEQYYSKVLMLGNENNVGSTIEFCNGEVNLLVKFQEYLKKLDPDLIVGWNVVAFDLKFIYERCEKLKVNFSIGKENTKTRIFQSNKGDWQIDILGRAVIDGPRALKMNFFNFESYKLNSVAKVLLNDAKDIDEDESFDKWGEIERRFKEDKEALARYNLKDAVLVTQIFNKTKLIDLLINRSIISGMLLDKVGGSTASFDHFFLPEFHKSNFVASDVGDVEWDKEAKGGFVLNPVVGIHSNVIVLDFKSLYPTVIRTFYIDPLSRLQNEIEPITTPTGFKFSKSLNILPLKIAELLQKRAKAKKDKNDNLSMAIKILMNSFYGVMGSSGCRFYHHDLPDAITGTGQWILKTTIEYLESLGLVILYGDTDSIFVQVNEFQTIFQKGEDLVKLVNEFLTKKIGMEFKTDSHLEIQFDKVFKTLILTSTRNNLEGAKKRYAGLLIKDIDGSLSEEIVLTGMEFVRSDWSRLAKNFQFELIKRIFKGEDILEFIYLTIKELEQGKYNDELVLSKRLTKPFEEYVKNIPPHVRAARILFQELNIRKNKSDYIMTKKGAVPIELAPTDFDYEYYIEKQLSPIANSLLPLLGLEPYNFLNKQLSLF